MSYTRVYPISDTFKQTLKTPDSFRDAIKLNRILMKRFDAGMNEVEILILLASYTDAIPAEMIYKHMDHTSPETIKRLLRSLKQDRMIVQHTDLVEDGSAYSISLSAATVIKQITLV